MTIAGFDSASARRGTRHGSGSGGPDDPLLDDVLSVLNGFSYQTVVGHQADAERKLPRVFDPDFPFLLHFYAFPDYPDPGRIRLLNWHEHLELILPIEGHGRFALGDAVVDFEPGDLLVVDNLKLHGVVEWSGRRRSLVVHFMPEFVFGVGSCSCDQAFLEPFYARTESTEPILRSQDPDASSVHAALRKMVEAYVGVASSGEEDRRSGCKLWLLEVLYHLRRHFDLMPGLSRRVAEQKKRMQRLKILFDYLRSHHPEKMSLGQAASMVGMCPASFKRFFKRATGTTFTKYVNRLRVTHGAQLLRETDLSVAEIAQKVGFSQQSYFNLRFREHFHATPRHYRSELDDARAVCR